MLTTSLLSGECYSEPGEGSYVLLIPLVLQMQCFKSLFQVCLVILTQQEFGESNNFLLCGNRSTKGRNGHCLHWIPLIYPLTCLFIKYLLGVHYVPGIHRENKYDLCPLAAYSGKTE